VLAAELFRKRKVVRRVKPKTVERRLSWNLPPNDCALLESETHVWAADLDEISFVREFGPVLSPDESERSARFHFQRDRANFIAARGLLRTILSHYTKTPAADLRFNYSANGKPSLASSAQFQNLNFNLSHSDGLAVYAFARNRELGIDVESLRPFSDMEGIAARCFSKKDQTDLRALQKPQQEERFFRYWTRTEAILKCSGEGFSEMAGKVEDAPFDGIIQELEPAEGFIASLAVRGKPFVLKTWQFHRETFV
jgi:4'-phosphopantetheinyl transferase